MKRCLLLTIVLLVVGGTVLADSAYALKHITGAGGRATIGATARARSQPWHAGYYHSAWGMPVALVVPPTAEFQTHWGWGVGNTRVTKIWHQFERNYPGPGEYTPGMFRPTPAWPSDTDQFGVYHIRGPW